MNQLVFYSNKYFKSATLNTSMSQRTERILALFFVPISLAVFAIITIAFIMIINSTVLYFKFVALKKEYQPKVEAIKQNEDIWKLVHPNETRWSETIMLDLTPYTNSGIDNINPTDTSFPEKAIDLQTDNIISQIITIVICLFSFSLPWIIIRVFYWVKIADKTSRN